MIENPFITYGYESPEYFCDREAEAEQLMSLLVNGNHTALISPRRMGKTGLIRHCFANPRLSEHYYTFLIDIYATKTLQDMVYQLGHGIVRRLKPRGQAAIDKFLQVVTSLRTGISFDGQGNASWNLGIGDIKSPVFTLEEIFSYLQSAERPCIVAIDEFQTISQYQESNVEAMLRTYVQQCRNAVFVFSGSQPSMMSEMFSSPARPFYQSVSLMFLKPVPLEAYEDFAKKHFLDYGKDVADGVVSIDKAESQIVHQNEEAYKDMLFQLTTKQRDLFIAISKEGKASQITGSSFLKRHHLPSASSVQKAASILLAKQLLTHYQGVYELYDKFMATWLRRS